MQLYFIMINYTQPTSVNFRPSYFVNHHSSRTFAIVIDDPKKLEFKSDLSND